MLLHPLLHRTTNPLTHTNGPSFLVCVVLSCYSLLNGDAEDKKQS